MEILRYVLLVIFGGIIASAIALFIAAARDEYTEWRNEHAEAKQRKNDMKQWDNFTTKMEGFRNDFR
jgi:uncharacterized protein YpmB